MIQGFTYNLMAHVALDYPQGGETFTEGEFVIIQWHIVIPHVTLNFDLFFSSDGGATWETIQMDIPADQFSYQWVVPNLETGQARVSVIMDNEGQDYQDESMNFTIVFAPMLPFMEVAPMDTTFECNSNQEANIQAWLDNHGGAMAFGFCGDLEWTDSYDGLSNGCGATGTAMVFFTATDECGSTTMAATLTIADTESPVMENPAVDLVMECTGNGNLVELTNWLASQGGAVASDVCGNVSWTNNYSNLSDDCGATGSAWVTFTATDDCGNSIATSATFSIQDNISPTIIIAAQNTSIECSTTNPQSAIQDWLNSHGGAIVSDACSQLNWTNNYSSLSNDCGATGSASVTFTATDDCGNSIGTTATYTIEDHTPPSILTAAHDTIINCGDPNPQTVLHTWLEDHGGASAGDLCGIVSWTNDFPVLADTCNESRGFFVTFTARDECGNSESTSANLTLLSITAVSPPGFSEFDFKISPNPVVDILKVDLGINESLPVHLMLFDTWGKPVLSRQESANEIYIPVSGYAPGVYFLQLKTFHGVHTRKVVIN